MKEKDKSERILLAVLFLIYLMVLLRITVFRTSYSDMQNVNLIPFSTVTSYMQSILYGNKIIGISNVLGNLIMFFPFGYMLASLFPKMRKAGGIIILSFIFSVGIEIAQYVFARGQADVDDVILNTLGGLIGYGIFVSISRFVGKRQVIV